MKIIEKIKSAFFAKGEYVSLDEIPPDCSHEGNTDNTEIVKLTVIPKESKQAIIKRNKKEFRIVTMKMLLCIMFFLMVFILEVTFLELKRDTNNTISKLQVEVASLSEQISDFKSVSEEVVTKNTTNNVVAVLNPIDKESVYYGKTYKDLHIDYESEGETVGLMKCISFVEYGTAGSSLQMYSAGYNFVLLSQMSEEQWQEFPSLLNTLTPVQLDFLSYRVVDAYHFAVDIINGEDLLLDINSMGIEPETYQNCTEIQVIKFLSYMMNLFEEKSVNYEWEEYDILSLFH